MRQPDAPGCHTRRPAAASCQRRDEVALERRRCAPLLYSPAAVRPFPYVSWRSTSWRRSRSRGPARSSGTSRRGASGHFTRLATSARTSYDTSLQSHEISYNYFDAVSLGDRIRAGPTSDHSGSYSRCLELPGLPSPSFHTEPHVQQKTRTGTAYTSSPTGPAGAALGVGDDHWISVEVHGKHLDVAIDGSPVSSADNLQRSAGGLGFVISGCTVQFDNVVVTRLSR
jgi:hypothetical protein